MIGQLRSYTADWVAIVYPSLNFLVLTTHMSYCLSQCHFAKVCEEQVLSWFTLPDRWGCISALDGLLLSLLHVSGWSYFSTTYPDIVFESVSFQLNLAQSDWEHCVTGICPLLLAFLQASSLLWISRTAMTTGSLWGQVVRWVGNLLASYSWHLREGL